MSRPNLNPIPLADVLPPRKGQCYATFTPGQWDVLLAALYQQGCVLLEVNDDEKPARAYRRATT